MPRALLALFSFVIVLAVACGGHKKSDSRPSAPEPTATSASSQADDDSLVDDDEASSDDDADDDEASGESGGILGQFLSLGLGGATGRGPQVPGAIQQGGGDLEQYLLSEDDLPGDFTLFGTFNFSLPANAAEDFRGGDMAAAMFMSGDMTSSDVPTGGGMIMVMVMRPDDPSAIEDLGDEFGSFDPSELGEFGDGSFLGIELKDVEELDTDGLGENAGGVGFTMDMSGFFENLQEGFGDDLGGEDVPPEAFEALSNIRMRMLMFGESEHMGMVMQISFGDGASSEDLLPLAATLKDRLPD